ncbi:OmpP1/FadL family transporter [Rhizobium mesosinicum]|uniref:Transporter n=1 Tax=Rhizobium mesosinicum TaxID=335017 RepID=A0ABS7GTT1_9HYPH|nr:OmpP1/FadL family transporter [Rhizobium mesosinicum]MBW9053363.1 transporter [Rhizobium mesosinicum]
MAARMFSRSVTSLIILSAVASPSFAGGLERGGYNIDQLFDTSQFSVQTGMIYVNPQRKLNNARDVDPTDGTVRGSTSADETEPYYIPYAGLKAGVGDADCLLDYSEPFGAHTNPGANWVGAQSQIETEIKSRNYGATCSYRFDVGPGQFRVIGGGFYQHIEGFRTRLVAPLPFPLSAAFDGTGRLDLEDNGWGWRAGVAYEIPEYAFRASLVYNSRVDYDNLTGTVDLTQVPGAVSPGNPFFGRVTPVKGSAEAPDSLELKLQSGIAPDWLAFGSVKWMNWSLLQSVQFCPTNGLPCPAGGLTSLDLHYRDGWTITGGLGHKFTDKWAGAVSLTWDRGTSQGYGSQTDSWTVGVGAAYTPTENIEWRVAGAVGVLTSGSSGTVTSGGITYGNDVTYSFGNDLVAALSTSLKVKF